MIYQKNDEKIGIFYPVGESDLYIQIGNLTESENIKENAMVKNISSADRVIRIVLGVVILLLGIYFKSLWGFVGLIPLGTALVRFCPAYKIFGISTLKQSAEPK